MQQYNTDTDQTVADIWETRVLAIEGMTCENCVKSLTRALKKVNGIKDIKIDLRAASATITFDTTKTDMDAIRDTILASGYKPTSEISK